ncbi:MAG: hypothetical protein ABUJ92_00460 [Desulfobacterales bacterium]
MRPDDYKDRKAEKEAERTRTHPARVMILVDGKHVAVERKVWTRLKDG